MMPTSYRSDTAPLRADGLVLLLVGVMMLLPGMAQPEQVTCGETITHSIT